MPCGMPCDESPRRRWADVVPGIINIASTTIAIPAVFIGPPVATACLCRPEPLARVQISAKTLANDAAGAGNPGRFWRSPADLCCRRNDLPSWLSSARRTGLTARACAEEIAHSVRAHSAILDREICFLNPDGSSNFKDLLFRRECRSSSRSICSR